MRPAARWRSRARACWRPASPSTPTARCPAPTSRARRPRASASPRRPVMSRSTAPSTRAAAEVDLLQVPDEHLLRLRVLELVDETQEVREPLPVHAAVRDLLLAVLEERLRIETRAVAELHG